MLEIWKTWNYCYTISVPLFLLIIVLLYYLNYMVAFWIVLICFIISTVGSGWRISRLEKKLFS